jgi:hypothetical protein
MNDKNMENHTHPHMQEPPVQKYWHQGKHPQCCKGQCMLIDAGGILCCHVCGWDDVMQSFESENN